MEMLVSRVSSIDREIGQIDVTKHIVVLKKDITSSTEGQNITVGLNLIKGE
jgi:hypothetical protein